MGRTPGIPISGETLQKKTHFTEDWEKKMRHACKRQLNRRLSVKQEELAKICGYSKSYLQRAEEGKGSFDVYIIAEYIENFGYSPNYFFTETLDAEHRQPSFKQQIYLNDLQDCASKMDSSHKQMPLDIARMFAKTACLQ